MSKLSRRTIIKATTGAIGAAILPAALPAEIAWAHDQVSESRATGPSACATPNSGSGCWDDMSIAIPVFEGTEEQDIVGPLEMFYWMSLFEGLPSDRRPIGESDFGVDFISDDEFLEYFYPKVAPKAKVFTVGPSVKPYRMSSGLQIVPDFSHDNAPAANMIVSPGGRGAHDLAGRHKDGTIDYIKTVANSPGNKYVMSVCTGAFLLGAAGLLDGDTVRSVHITMADLNNSSRGPS